jgi:hypothetical protein
MKKWLVGWMCGGLLATAAWGQILTFEFSALAGSEATADSNANDANLASSTISRGAGLTAAGNTQRFNATGWALESIANAIAGDDYMEFTITPQPGYQFDVSSIYVQWQRSSTGNSVVSLRSSVDNYATALDADWVLDDVTTTLNKTWTFSQANSTVPVTYRLYSYAESTAGSGGPGDGAGNDIVVNGTVSVGGFGVGVDKQNGFEVEQGSSRTIIATAAGGTEPYAYGWATDMTAGDYSVASNVFTILTTAALGDYSATVTATDNAAQTASNTVTFSVVAPAVKYGIAITPPVNGSVETAPADEAEEGQAVTITATPDSGYRVASIAVVAEDLSPVAVVSGVFTMPAQAVTVTVLFEVYEAPDVLIDFETVTGFNSYAPGTSTVSGVLIRHDGALRGTTASDPKNGAASARVRYLGTNVGYLATAEAFAEPISKINFLYADYGSDNTTTFKVQVSSDGASWQDVGEAAYDPDGATLLGATIDSIPANMTYFQILTLGGEADRVCIDDIGLWFGAASYGVTFDKQEGFEVEEGTATILTATAANGTAPYAYGWDTDMAVGDYLVDSNSFGISGLAAVGSYYATVTATDSSDPVQVVSNTIHFSVVAPAPKYAISIVTNAPANGTVTTTPATEAEAGQSVTVTATPAGGYAVQSIEVNGGAVTVTGNTFTMPAEPVTVTVTFAVYEGGALIISQYYEGASYDKWIEIYNPGASAVDLAADGYRLGNWANAAREGWKTGVAPSSSMALTGTIPAGGTYLASHTSAALPDYIAANIQNGTVCAFSGDDSMVLYTGETYAFANVVDAFGLTGDTAGNKSYVRKTTVTSGVNTDFNADDWDQFTNAEVDAAAESTNERLGYHSTGPAVFGVTFDQTSGFEVEEGTTDVVVATAANGTAPFNYSWSSTLGGAYYTAIGNEFTILATAPIGDYSAQVIATDSSDPVQGVTNSLNFSVVAPPTKYAITIVTNNFSEGIVTTTPATEAAAGTAVTVTATPAEGYAVESIVVNGGAVTVTGSTFTMPAGPATVTVTFMAYEAPDVLIDFEDYTGGYEWKEYVAGGVTWTITNVYAGNTVDDAKNGTKAGRFENNRGGAGNPAKMTSTAFTQAITRLNFWYANYGVNDGGAFKVQVSDDGATWTDVGDAEYNPDSKILVQGVIDPIPVANATYVQFITTAGSAQRVNVDDIGIYFGAAAPSLSYTGATTIQLGQTFNLTFTANGGSPGSWDYQVRNGASELVDSGFSNVFGWQPVAAGVYYLTMNAYWAEGDLMASRLVTLTVTSVDPDEPAVIISGDTSGTVGVEMSLALSITNETANDWFIDLKDPDGLDDYSYGFDGSTFTLTPAKAGTYVLVATAETGSGNYSNAVNLVISGGGGDENPPIPAITFVAGTGFNFEVPAGHTVARVEGAVATVAGQAFTWTTLNSPADYEVSGTQVTIKLVDAESRLIRVWFNAVP